MSEQQPAKGVEFLQTQLALCEHIVRTSIGEAETAYVKGAAFDHVVDNAYKRALAYMTVSAKVGMALARMKGEHTSNIRIHRTQTTEQELRVEFPAPEPREPRPGVKPLDPATEAKVNQIYDDWLRARADKQGDVKHFRDDEPQEDDDENDPWGVDRPAASPSTPARKAEEGAPHAENLGSNSEK